MFTPIFLQRSTSDSKQSSFCCIFPRGISRYMCFKTLRESSVSDKRETSPSFFQPPFVHTSWKCLSVLSFWLHPSKESMPYQSPVIFPQQVSCHSRFRSNKSMRTIRSKRTKVPLGGEETLQVTSPDLSPPPPAFAAVHGDGGSKVPWPLGVNLLIPFLKSRLQQQRKHLFSKRANTWSAKTCKNTLVLWHCAQELRGFNHLC